LAGGITSYGFFDNLALIVRKTKLILIIADPNSDLVDDSYRL